jgi:hypothetical protein
MNSNCFDYICETRDLNVKLVWLNVDAAAFSVPKDNVKDAIKRLETFSKVPEIMKEGTKAFSQIILKNEKELQFPKFAYKVLVGNNLKDMHDANL